MADAFLEAPRRVLDGERVAALMAVNGGGEAAYVLEAANQGLTDIYDLSEVPRLRTLDVTNNRLRDLRNLAGCPHLRELRAGSNRVDDADDVAVCRELEALHLQDNLLGAGMAQIAALLRTNGTLKLLDLAHNAVRCGSERVRTDLDLD